MASVSVQYMNQPARSTPRLIPWQVRQSLGSCGARRRLRRATWIVSFLLQFPLLIIFYHNILGNTPVSESNNPMYANSIDPQLSRDIYPQLSTPPDPYARLSSSTKQKWTDDCDNQCHWTKCALARPPLESALRRLLQEWQRLTERLLNIQSIVQYGSLIAALHRNTTLMPWDTDVDVLIWASDVAKLEELAKEYNQQNTGKFSLELQPNWRKRYVNEEPHWGGRDYSVVPFVAVEARLAHFYEIPGKGPFSVHVDVWAMYSSGGADNNSCSSSVSSVEILDLDYDTIQIPCDWMFPLQSCYLHGVAVHCPVWGSKVLSKAFDGEDLKEPDHFLDETTGCWKPKNDGVTSDS